MHAFKRGTFYLLDLETMLINTISSWLNRFVSTSYKGYFYTRNVPVTDVEQKKRIERRGWMRLLTEKDVLVDVVGVQVEVKVERPVGGSLVAPVREVHRLVSTTILVARGQKLGQQGQIRRVERGRTGGA